MQFVSCVREVKFHRGSMFQPTNKQKTDKQTNKTNQIKSNQIKSNQIEQASKQIIKLTGDMAHMSMTLPMFIRSAPRLPRANLSHMTFKSFKSFSNVGRVLGSVSQQFIINLKMTLAQLCGGGSLLPCWTKCMTARLPRPS